MQIFSLRHGQSLANVAGVISSSPSATREHGLSPAGEDQARAAADQVVARAKSLGCGVAICSSDYMRARQTAEIVHVAVRAAGVDAWPTEGVSLREALRERYFGSFDGGADTEYATVWREDALDSAHEQFGVESVDSVLGRALRLLEELPSELGASSSWLLLLVAHGDVLQILQTHFAGVCPRLHRSLEHLPTATLRELGTLPRAQPNTE
jgi:probable phosphoglycerate mutase